MDYNSKHGIRIDNFRYFYYFPTRWKTVNTNNIGLLLSFFVTVIGIVDVCFVSVY
jgi:hypothetical protein